MTSLNISQQAPFNRLSAIIEHARHLLPAQGPINVFIHHNTLHAFEHLPFHRGVVEGGRVFNCHPYLPEARYREYLERGRIQTGDLERVLQADLGDRAEESICSLGSRLELRLAMLRFPLRMASSNELRWFVAETDALRRFRADAPAEVRQQLIDQTRHWAMRDLRVSGNSHSTSGPSHHQAGLRALLEQFGVAGIDQWSEAVWEAFTLQALWRIAREGVHGIPAGANPASAKVRHRDLLLEATGVDCDRMVDQVLIQFCAAFLDQGFATCALPDREVGFFRAFAELASHDSLMVDAWRRGLKRDVQQLIAANTSPLESIHASLELLGVAESQWEEFITQTLLVLRGWGGMIRQMELREDRVAHAVPEGSVLEFLAVRLILDRAAVEYVARKELDYHGPLSRLRAAIRGPAAKPESHGLDQRAFVVFQLAQVLGWLPADLSRLTKPQWTTLIEELESFPSLERRRVFQLAFERRFRNQTLDAIQTAAANNQHANPAATDSTPSAKFQIMCCLDEREESFRRHLEELRDDVETFGAAGFYNMAIYYRGAANAHYIPLCPIVVRPKVWVQEEVVYSMSDVHRRRAITRRALGTISHRVHVGSRGIAGGILSAGVGILATVPLVARILFPRLTAKVRKAFGRYTQPPPTTQLHLERLSSVAGEGIGQIGLSLPEMVTAAENLLRDIGLTENFSSMVLILGHGSSSLNNPHNSAYNCGACGGGAGGPNARAIARILNDSRVRFYLAERGLNIPEKTLFIGGLHNTCNDSIAMFDLDRLPPARLEELQELQALVDQACSRNAHERCRRFYSAPLDMTFDEARRHVEERAEDLSQTRPECGHASNAVCYVGRRQRIRSLFMDRRTFLTSYDPTKDTPDYAILTRLLQAAVPVCAGINLEYYFSYVDPTGWGSGTKLPHNITSLLGVMDGAASDLRTGLPWQMVEIHEPIRLLFVIEATPQMMNQIMDKNEGIGRLCRNDWVQLAVLDPDSARIQLLVDGKFVPYDRESGELPTQASSVDWYRGWRENLGYAWIEKSNTAAPAAPPVSLKSRVATTSRSS